MVLGNAQVNEEIKIDIIKYKDEGAKSKFISDEGVETRDENEASPEIEASPELESSPEVESSPKSVIPSETSTASSKEQHIVASLIGEAAKFHGCTSPSASDHIKIDLKFWQDAFLKIVYTRLNELGSCNSSCDYDVDEEELKAMFSNYHGEGEEIDEDGYREQIREYADFVATNAVIPRGNDTSNDIIDPEERKLEYKVRREIASTVIGQKMLEGYALEEIPCLKCGNYLMRYYGVIDCVVCPVLVREIDKAVKIKREEFLKQKAGLAHKAVIEAEAKKKADEEALKNLRTKEATLRKDSTLLRAAAEVAAEQVVAASSKNYDVRKDLEDARKVSADAWALVKTRIDQLKVEIEQSKVTIEKAVATIEQSVAQRKRINNEMSAKVKEAVDAKADAEFQLDTATREEHDASLSAAAAAEAVRLALVAQEAADGKYEEAQHLVKALALVVEEKTTNLTDAISTAKKVNKKENDKVQKAVQESARIEKQTTAEVEKSNAAKCKAEQIANKLEQEKIHKEAKSVIAERLAQLAIESKEQAIRDAKDIKEKIIESGEEMISFEEKIINDRVTLEARRQVALVKFEAVTKLRRELQLSEFNFENSAINEMESNENEVRDSCCD